MPFVSMNNLAIAILAGGASSRMGRDKAGLRLANNQTLLEYMCKKYSNCLVFSSGKSSTRVNNYPEVADLFDLRLGPVAGIVSSLSWLINTHPTIKHCIFIPVDLAYSSMADLSLLIAAKYAVAYFKDNPLPLKIEISAASWEVCHKVSNEMQLLGGYSVSKFIQHFQSRIELSSITPQSLTNINYIEDWERFLNESMLK